jgi:hypothetical protein
MLQSPFRVGVKPKDGNQYVNEIKIGDVKLVVNTSIEEADNVQRVGVVFSIPMTFSGNLEIGDEVVVHHNVFRTSLNDWGVPMESSYHFKDDMYFIGEDMIYLRIRNGEVTSYNDNVFILPIVEDTIWEGQKLIERQGIVKISNEKLRNQGIEENTKVVFRKFCEYKFNIFGMEMYKMQDKRILATLN